MPRNKRDVIISREAERQSHAAAQWYATHNQRVSDDWIAALSSAFDTLATQAERFPLARENARVPYELREMLYGLGKRTTHRVLYEIRNDKVIVHQIRHVAQRDMLADDD